MDIITTPRPRSTDNIPSKFKGYVALIKAVEEQAMRDYLNGSFEAYNFLNSTDKYKGKLAPIEEATQNRRNMKSKEEVERRLREFKKYGVTKCAAKWGISINAALRFVQRHTK